MTNDYSARQLYREIKIMRKLTELKKNVFTTQIKDVLLPLRAYVRKEEEDYLPDLLADEAYIQDLRQKIECFSDDLLIDLDAITHLFIVMEHVDSDIKKILDAQPRIELDEDHIITILYN